MSRSALARVLPALALVSALPLAAGERPPGRFDDGYSFDPRGGESRALALEPVAGGLGWTWSGPDPSRWDTALLQVKVSAEAADAAPRVELAAGGRRLVQFLDPGADGLRWLNLSGLRGALSEGAVVELEAHGARVEPGGATLRVFDNGLKLDGRLLVLAPHPDDAEIAAFGLYAGRNATIVTVTSGNAGDFNYRESFADPAEHYLFKGYLRAVDSVTVPWQGGIPPERCYNLGYFDARLKPMRATPETPLAEMYGPNQDVAPYRRANLSKLLPNRSRANSWRNLVEDLALLFEKLDPELVVAAYPQLDVHADHQYATVAAVEAMARWKRKDVRFLLYTNHASENRYPFGPAGSVVSLPPWPGPELPVAGVYSHPLDPDLQRRKLYALESMHDLRLSPSEQAGCLPPGTPARRDDYPRLPEVDYFRRAVRPEELFFVYDRAQLEALIASFLAAETEAAEPAPPAQP